MGILVWVGAIAALAGVGILIGCIRAAVRARRAELDDAQMRARLQRLVAWNMAALGLSALGLMAVILGLSLGQG